MARTIKSKKSGGTPAWKAEQKNSSVYLGRRDDPVVAFLPILCANLNMSESEFFRKLYHQYLIDYDLMTTTGRLRVGADKIIQATRSSDRVMPRPTLRKR